MNLPTTIGHYRITSKLGEGGMGAVYRATDTKLNREVAIKVLPAALAGDAQYMARFEREAQVLASLNHPNIATLYGIEQGALVMELVEGADLRGPMPLDEAIPIARQIAAGLEAAHERGIVHRDLKPANIKITPAGVVKLLDFGLAKTVESPAATAGSPTMSPTLSLAMTEAGMILGTAAYMSPEQARGKPVDKRADIWAFGVVLYELLTDKMLFGGGESVTDILASVVKDTPDFTRLPAETPPRIRRLLERCLRKDAHTRLRDIGEARVVLDEPEPPPKVASAVPTAQSSRLPWIAAALFAVSTVIMASLWLRPKPADSGPAVARFQISLPPGTRLPSPVAAAQWVPSPDGRNLAMIAEETVSGKSALWVRPVGATELHRMDMTEGALYPFWSPDGQSIGFFADGKLKRVPPAGGSAQVICEVGAKTSSGNGGAWSQDGTILFAPTAAPLMRVPAMGGIAQPATVLANGEQSHSWPQFLPDGRHILYLSTGERLADNRIYVQELGSAQRVEVLKNPTRAVWAPPGYLLFVRDGTLLAQHLNPKTYRLEGEPVAVAQDVLYNQRVGGRSAFSVSQNGVLAYRSGNSFAASQFSWRNREGKVLALVGKPDDFFNPSISANGKRIAVLVGEKELDAWVMNLDSGSLERMTRGVKGLLSPTVAWSRDGQRLTFAVASGGIREVSVASGEVTTLTEEPLYAEEWSPDGRALLCTDNKQRNVYLLSRESGAKPQLILGTPYNKRLFRFSPDGKYVAYASTESGQTEVFVASFPSFAVKHKVSNAGGQFPGWAQDGKTLYYRSADGQLMEVAVRTGGTLELGVPKALFRFGAGSAGNRFVVGDNGQRFLIYEPVDRSLDRPEITLVLNWTAELRQP